MPPADLLPLAEPAPEAPPPAPGTHFRKGLGLRAQIIEPLNEDYRGHLVRFAREHDYRIRAGELRFALAREFGFCYGVDRAIEYAYEARVRFPERRIFLTGEIIHNPYVNRRLDGFGIRILEPASDLAEKFAEVEREDVVLLPAFGVPTSELEFLRARGAVLVDTTCGSVMNVWKNVGRYQKAGFTSIVHGKWAHEETRATVSRAGTYLVVRDLGEAEDVCRYLESGGGASAPFDRGEFLRRYAPHACSADFDPDRSLGRVGLANQTTMLSSESLAIAERFRTALERRYGPEELPHRFRSFDTICSATQERQDALVGLLEEPLDLVLVIGGFNSSNTSHLAEICEKKFPSYHISGPECLRSADEILHRVPEDGAEVTSRGWLPEGPAVVGVTSGASTPDVMVDETIERVLGFRNLTRDDCRPDPR